MSSDDMVAFTPQEALLLKKKPSTAPPVSLDYQSLVVDLLTKALFAQTAIKSPVPNRDSIYVGQMIVQTSGVPQQLPSLKIPDGFTLVIKAKKANTNNVTLGGDMGTASHNGSSFFSLAPNEKIGYAVDNANVIWLDVVTAGEGVELTVET